ncbi:MFS transporter [uncultured Dubosiella sp.]|uniref:MFS transporter n=1 Tax=uncultured Dubosiella sp. TaxID=1937011 RepID=UPI0025B490E6|nr:MFS transporter [uncultured Dubosiella sp.]
MLSSKSFLLLCVGQVISLFGNAAIRFLLPLWLLEATGSPSLFGLITGIALLPSIALSMVGGVLADRWRKERIMAGLDFFTALLVAVVALVWKALDPVVVCAIALLVLYAIQGAYQPTVNASVPALLDEANWMKGNAIVSGIGQLSAIIGPVLAALFNPVLSKNAVLLVLAVCFFVSALLELFLKIPFQPKQRTLREDFQTEWRVVLQNHLIRRGLVLIALFNLVVSGLISVSVPVLVTQHWYAGASADFHLSLLEAAIGIGGITGALFASTRVKAAGTGEIKTIMAGCAVVLALIALLLGIAQGDPVSFGALAVGLWLLMALGSMASIVLLTWLETITPADQLGKTMAFVMASCQCAVPLGNIVSGFLIQSLPIALCYWIAAFLSGLLALAAHRFFQLKTK